MKKNIFISLLISAVLSEHAFAQLTMTPVANLQAAIQNSLLGAGVVVSNITYNGVPNSLAEFTGNSSTGISNGLYIGTGSAMTVSNPAVYFMSDSYSAPGDSDLQSIASSTTQDAGVLEFDFKVQGDSVQFNFVFASEEYSDFAGSAFNDVFGFFISGPGITGHQNMALIPATTLPVSINNVNNGYASVGTIPTGPCMNCAYYNDNTNDTTCAFDGMTTVITATAAVQPCTFYHIKIAVGNVGDGAFDSGIFLESNSFTPCGPLSVFKGLVPVEDTLRMCSGGSLTLTSCLAPNYLWNTGDTTQSIIVTQPGNYEVTVLEGTCSASSQQIIILADTSLAKPQVLQNGNLLSSTVVNPTYQYGWFKDGSALGNTNNSSYTIVTGGCYQVMVSDTAGCQQISDSLCLSFAGINGTEIQPFAFHVFPNPSHGQINISFINTNNEVFHLSLSDLSGKQILTISTDESQLILDNNFIQPGLYFIILENSQTLERARMKIVVE